MHGMGGDIVTPADLAWLEELLAALQTADATHRRNKERPDASDHELAVSWHERLSAYHELERELMRHAPELIAAARKAWPG